MWDRPGSCLAGAVFLARLTPVGNVVEASRLGDILRGLPDVTSVERDEMRRA